MKLPLQGYLPCEYVAHPVDVVRFIDQLRDLGARRGAVDFHHIAHGDVASRYVLIDPEVATHVVIAVQLDAKMVYLNAEYGPAQT